MPTRNAARKALNRAELPARDKYVYRALLDVADNMTLEIPDRFQPYRQSDRYVFGASRRTVQRALSDLQLHGWVSWTRKQKGRQRGQWPNHYTLSVGWDCDCGRERQDDEAKSARMTLNNHPKSASPGASISARQVDIPAGQAPVLPKGVHDRGEVREGVPERVSPDPHKEWAARARARWPESLQSWPAGSVGEDENRSRP